MSYEIGPQPPDPEPEPDVRQEAERLLANIRRAEDGGPAMNAAILNLELAATVRALLAQLAAQEDENVRVWNLRDADRREIVAAEYARDAALAQVAQLRELVEWTLGESATDEFPSLPDDWPRRKFYWRKELRKRFEALAGPPEGQP